MAATILSAPAPSSQQASHNALISAAETNQLSADSGRLYGLLISTDAASGITVTIYDHATANTNPIWSEAAGASAFVVRDFDMPTQNGLRVVTSGLSGTVRVCVLYRP
jgi:hypothetical protein